ncbi:MAG: hypothetical protein KDA44_04265 [Planctomycetales bacterium]|nr:hypothetical protein [Planctomycetales bacterium]
MSNEVVIRRMKQTESAATVLVECGTRDGEPPAGVVRGPFCEFARTLPAEFLLQPLAAAADQHPAAATVVVDPCYWTPELPFQYELRLRGDDSVRRFALRRWYRVGTALQLSGRRVVLRGAAVAHPASGEATSDLLTAARRNAATLLTTSPTDDFCERASQQGVALVADLRMAPALSSVEAHRLAGQGAVLMAIVDAAQLEAAGQTLRNAGVMVALASSHSVAAIDDSLLQQCDAFAVELQSGELPSAAFAACARPVLVVRRGVDGADVAAARVAADALQAELAPGFDFAGYFVETR